jgi:hypothetical protein
VTVLALAVLVTGTFTTWQQYFVTWARLPSQRLNNDGDLTAIADYLNERDLTGTAVFVSAIHYRHPTLAYLARSFNSILWLTGGHSLVVPRDRDALVIVSRSTPLPEEWWAGWESHLVAAPPGSGNVPDFHAYQFRAGETPPFPSFIPLDENFGNIASLTGYRTTAGEDEILIDLRWRVENLVEADDMLPYTRLYDAWGNQWSQGGGFTYPSEQWQPGDTLITRLAVPLPAGMPPGDYVLKTGMYSANTQTNLPHLDSGGGYAGDRAVISTVHLPGRATADPPDFVAANPMTAPERSSGLDRDLTLLGFALPQTSPRQGERLQLTLFWHTRAPLSARSLTLSLGGQTLFTGHPVQDSFPFVEWAPEQWLTDRYTLKVPADFPPGPADLMVSVTGYGTSTLTALEVTRVERAFDTPGSATRAGHDLGHQVALYGYELQAGEATTLTLYWQSLAPTDHDYTVFVHILDASGRIVAQADAQPRDGAYPTSLWVPGEFIADPYTFSLPPGAYTLNIGLYLSETGARLPVFDPLGDLAGDVVTLPQFQAP